MTTLQIVFVSIGGGLLLLAVMLTPLWILLIQTYFGNKTLGKLAEDLGGHLHSQVCCVMGQVAFQRKNERFNISVRTYKTNRSRRTMELLGAWPDIGTRITVYPESFWTRARKFLGLQDLKIGHKRFDDAFILQSNSDVQLSAALNTSAQDLLLKILNQKFGSTLNLAICGGQVAMSIETKPWDLELLRRQVEDLLELRSYMMYTTGIGSPEPGLGKLKSISRNGVCLVCGEGVQQHGVSCKRCRTPHHKECWAYIGSCSVYGCGEKRFSNH